MATIQLVTGITPAANVWAAATRELTDLDGDDYTAARAALLDRLDAAMTTRSSHSAADVWTAATRLLTQVDLEEVFDLPVFDSTYAATQTIASGAADTFGAWTQLIADVGAGRRLCLAVFNSNAADTNYEEVEFGEGAAPASAIARFVIPHSAVANTATVAIVPLWAPLADNVELRARCRDNAAARNHGIAVLIA